MLVPLLAGAVAVGFGLATLTKGADSAGQSPARLSIESSPSGASVLVDGVPRGETPLRLDLPEGTYRLEVESPAGRRAVTLRLSAGADVSQQFDLTQAIATAGSSSGGDARENAPAPDVAVTQPRRPAPPAPEPRPRSRREAAAAAPAAETGAQSPAEPKSAAAPPPPTSPPPPPEDGWVEVRAPVVLQVFEGGRSLGTTAHGRLALSPGEHELEFVNEEFEVRIARTVGVEPAHGLALDLDPRGRVSLNAEPWAEVWLGDVRLGETPLGNVSLPVGRHELVFRHPELGERRVWAVVRSESTTRLSVSYTR